MADDPGSDLLEDLPAALGDLIGAVGRGVADAQRALDAAAIEQLSAIATADGRVAETLRAIGYQPTWYRIPEMQAEINLSLTLARHGEHGGSAPVRLYATPLDASFSNKYFADATISSRISFKVVPVPPSPMAAELIVVPDLIGRTWADAVAMLDSAGIAHERDAADLREVGGEAPAPEALFADSDVVESSTPEAGEVMSPGVALLVRTRRRQLGMPA